MEEVIRKWVLDNAHKYGEAKAGSVISKVIAEQPEAKKKIKELMPKIQEIIQEVSKLSEKEITKELEKTAPALLEKQKIVEVKELKPLKGMEEGKVCMRMAPSPSGPLHIGHSFVLSLNSEYCKMFNGKFILRIDDTNPENIYGPSYELIPEDARWLTGDNVAEVACQSDSMDSYYNYAQKMIEAGAAYVCTCDSDEFRTKISKKEACPCRDLSAEEQRARWSSMFDGYEPGQAVMRIKTDITDPNPALRDWPAFRINDHEHAKQGTEYRVWPLMNFAVAINDYEHGITHSIRAMDHVDNAKRQAQIFDFFGWKKPQAEYFGRINFEGFKLSTSETRKQIEYGEYTGWDDIRLPFLGSFRRRGYQPGAFVKFAIEMGVNKNSKTMPKEDFLKMLDAFNRDIIDPVANRYFFVKNPVEINIKDAPEQECELPLHPDENRGVRKLKSGTKFLLAQEDIDKIEEGKLYRLMDCLNFRKIAGEYVFDSKEYEKYKEEGKGILHWLPADEKLVNVDVLMPDGEYVEGKGEPVLKDLEVGTVLQFERFGFLRLDSKDIKMTFWYAHN